MKLFSLGSPERPKVMEIERPLSVSDIKGFQTYLKDPDPNYSDAMSVESMYSFATQWQAELDPRDEPLTPQERQKFIELYLSVHNKYKEILLKNMPYIGSLLPELNTLGQRLKHTHPVTSIKELETEIIGNQALQRFGAIKSQSGLFELRRYNFAVFDTNALTGYRQEYMNERTKIYMNPLIERIPYVAHDLIVRSIKADIPLQFKIGEYSNMDPNRRDYNRMDRMVVFADYENIDRVLGICKEIASQRSSDFAHRQTPVLTCKVQDGISVAEEPSEEINELLPKGEGSYNGVRAIALHEVWDAVAKEVGGIKIIQNEDAALLLPFVTKHWIKVAKKYRISLSNIAFNERV